MFPLRRVPEAPNTVKVTVVRPVGTVQVDQPWVVKLASTVLVAARAAAPSDCVATGITSAAASTAPEAVPTAQRLERAMAMLTVPYRAEPDGDASSQGNGGKVPAVSVCRLRFRLRPPRR